MCVSQNDLISILSLFVSASSSCLNSVSLTFIDHVDLLRLRTSNSQHTLPRHARCTSKAPLTYLGAFVFRIIANQQKDIHELTRPETRRHRLAWLIKYMSSELQSLSLGL